MHGVFADAQHGGQFAATPVRRPVVGLSPRGRQDAGAQSGSQHTGLLAGMIGVQSIESGLPEALLPTNDGGRRGLELSLDRIEGRPFRQHQNQLGAKHVSGGQRTGLGDAAEVGMLLLGEQDLAANGHDSLDANSLVMVTLRQATSVGPEVGLGRSPLISCKPVCALPVS